MTMMAPSLSSSAFARSTCTTSSPDCLTCFQTAESAEWARTEQDWTSLECSWKSCEAQYPTRALTGLMPRMSWTTTTCIDWLLPSTRYANHKPLSSAMPVDQPPCLPKSGSARHANSSKRLPTNAMRLSCSESMYFSGSRLRASKVSRCLRAWTCPPGRFRAATKAAPGSASSQSWSSSSGKLGDFSRKAPWRPRCRQWQHLMHWHSELGIMLTAISHLTVHLSSMKAHKHMALSRYMVFSSGGS
mmetsp:Transcript_9827/g.23306  ORF Transcript_9827/g.23306 Transcript_9827/m.23306 type:complete len:245 (+) Transcript_9827:423-1157(+)